jgi:hypothetical protein
MTWEGHVAGKREMGNTNRILVEKTEGDLSVYLRNN